jgi:hypothetical protein
VTSCFIDCICTVRYNVKNMVKNMAECYLDFTCVVLNYLNWGDYFFLQCAESHCLACRSSVWGGIGVQIFRFDIPLFIRVL